MKTKIEITNKQIQQNNDNNKLTRGIKMKYFIILATMFTGLIAQDVPDLFYSGGSQYQAFYFFDIVEIDGESIDATDWVAAFNGTTCVGATLWNTSNCSAGVCGVPVMGFDSFTPVVTQGYCESGDVPTFKIYAMLSVVHLDLYHTNNNCILFI